MPISFGIKDIIDIFIVASLLYYIYRLMKESGTINIFYGIMAFIVVWALASEIFNMRLIGTILDKFMSIGVLILVILFVDQIKRFLVEVGSHRRWRFLNQLFHHHKASLIERQQIIASIPGSSSVYHQFHTLSAYTFVIPNVSTNAKANVIIGNPQISLRRIDLFVF